MTQQRILLVQLADIGDLILTTPAISALRQALPDAYLTLLTSTHAGKVIEGTGLVDEMVLFDKAKFNGSRAFFQPANLKRIWTIGKYDTVIFFHHFTLKAGTLKFWLIAKACGAKRRVGLQNGNGWFLTDSLEDHGFGGQHQADYWLGLVSLLGADSRPRRAVIAQEPSNLLPNFDGKTAVIHAGSGGYSLARRWSAEGFAQVADQLTAQGWRVVLVGGKDDDSAHVRALMQSSALDLVGKTTLPQLAGVLSEADVFIGADSGVMHIASAVGAPVVALFGASNHLAWQPYQTEATVIRSAPRCSPCSYVGHQIGLRDGCEARTCMRMIQPEQVLKAVIKGATHQEGQIMQQPIERTWSRIQVLGLPVDGITYAEWFDRIDEWVRGDIPRHVCTVNPEFLMIAQDDINFANILKRADLCVPDGVGLLWAAKRLGHVIPERVTGSDGVPFIAEQASKRGWKLFFLGAEEGIAKQAADRLRERHPNLQIVGAYSGSPRPEDEDGIVQLVNESETDILFVAYGAPNQDKWIARNLPRLKIKMAMGVGGSFDFIAGTVSRAPEWMQKAGLEWLYRLILQPWRLKRMLRLPRFVIAVIMRGEN
jgi:N-acetylglucosaminyldiphosphoundecaprenol N-acetyl-beta-D-mannosaminyltransferase